MSIDVLEDDVLMDMMTLIHSYVVHLFNINRLTKGERDRVQTASSCRVALDDEKRENWERDHMLRTKLMAALQRLKQEKVKLMRETGYIMTWKWWRMDSRSRKKRSILPHWLTR